MERPRQLAGGRFVVFSQVSNTARPGSKVTICVPPHMRVYNHWELSVALCTYSSKP